MLDLEKIKNTEFKTTVTTQGLTTIKQTDRNILRREMIRAFLDDFIEQYPELNALENQEGFAFDIPNLIEGAIVVTVKLSVPNLETNIEELHNDYIEKLEKAEEKEKAKKEKAKKVTPKTKKTE